MLKLVATFAFFAAATLSQVSTANACTLYSGATRMAIGEVQGQAVVSYEKGNVGHISGDLIVNNDGEVVGHVVGHKVESSNGQFAAFIAGGQIMTSSRRIVGYGVSCSPVQTGAAYLLF